MAAAAAQLWHGKRSYVAASMAAYVATWWAIMAAWQHLAAGGINMYRNRQYLAL